MSPWSCLDWRGACLGSKIGFVSLFVGLALALQIKLSGGKPSSAPVLHHRECRFQMRNNRDSRLHAYHCGHRLAALVALYRARSYNHGVDLGRLPSRPMREAGRKSSHATVSPITPAASSRSRLRSGRSWRCGWWLGRGIIWASGGSRC